MRMTRRISRSATNGGRIDVTAFRFPDVICANEMKAKSKEKFKQNIITNNNNNNKN